MRAGDIVRVDFGIPVGSTPAMVRPAIVVTADQTLAMYSTTFHVVPVTSNVGQAWASDVRVETTGLSDDSAAQCHLCTVVDRMQIVDDEPGDEQHVGAVALAQIRSVLADLFDLPA